MIEKLKFMGVVMGCLVVVYTVLGITVPFVAQIADVTANDTSVQAFGSTVAALHWLPWFLWIFPGVAGAGAVWWKWRQDDD